MKILFLRGGALGDFLLTLPAVAGLREKWPDAEIEMVAARKFGELVLGSNEVNIIRPIDQPGLAGFYAAGGKLDPEWSDYFSEFDLTISYLFDPDQIFATNWRRSGGTGEFISHDPRNPKEPAWKHLAQPLEKLGAKVGDPTRLVGEKLRSLQYPPSSGKRLVIHPGSGGKTKCWPMVDWIRELEFCVPPSDLEVIWLFGEAEAGWERGLPERWKSSRERILRDRPLQEVFSVLRSADFYLGHDSGISHLAGWSGVPCGLLFGPTDPAIWAPPGKNIRTWSRAGNWPKLGEWSSWVQNFLATCERGL
jgi:heptosyltransferase-2